MTENEQFIIGEEAETAVDADGNLLDRTLLEQQIRRTLGEYRANMFCVWAEKLDIASRQTIDDALAEFEERERAGTRTTLREFFHRIGIRKEQMGLLLSVKSYLEQLEKDKRFGNIAIKNGFVTREVVNTALTLQREEFRQHHASTRLGDMLVDNGDMTEEQRDLVLIVQSKKDPSVKSVVRTIRRNEREMEKKLNRLMDLTVSEDKLTAHIRLKFQTEEKFETAHIKNWLFAKEIRYGVYDTLIQEMLKERTPGKRYQVSEGQYPVPGRDAAVVYHFENDRKSPGEGGFEAGENPHGEVGEQGDPLFSLEDGKIPHVSKGDLLAVKTPPEPGKPGINVFGKHLPPRSVEDIQIWTGKGVYSEDRLSFYADVDGFPKLSGNTTITVEPEYQIGGDVDGESGDIIFADDVNIEGTVKGGVRIRCRNLTAHEILDAHIEATGNVRVKTGIRGAEIRALGDVSAETGIENTVLKDHGNIKAQYLKEVTLAAFGDVTVSKEIVDSNLVISGTCTVRSGGLAGRGTIAGSSITARGGIRAAHIGTPGASPCELTIGIDVLMEERIETLKKKLTAAVAMKNRHEKELAALDREIATVDERIIHMEKVRESVTFEIDACRKRLDSAEKKDDRELSAHIENELFEFQAKSTASIEALESYYLNRNEIRRGTDGILEKLEISRERIKSILGRIEDCSRNGDGKATVEVDGIIHEATTINGVHGGITLARRLSGVTIEEVRTPDSLWKMMATRKS